MSKYILVKQTEENDCGLACFNMLLLQNCENINLDDLKKVCNYKNNKMTFFDLHNFANRLCYYSAAYYVNDIKEITFNFLPCIAQIKITNGMLHFVVLFTKCKNYFLMGDPAKKMRYIHIDFFHKQFTGYIFKIKKISPKV